MNLSIIVPVYNEEARLAETAQTLLEGLSGAAQVIFVCNGCTDRSESILKEVTAGRARILSLPEPNKASAIRTGEKQLSSFPRFYVDADVLISGHDIVTLAEMIEARALELVSPRMRPDLSGASGPIRAVQQVWHSLPHVTDEGFHGVLGVSAAGRSRWGEFPDVVADDTFIAGQIPRSLKAIDERITQITRPPLNFWSTVRVRQRWRAGEKQLRSLGYNVPRAVGQRRALLRLAIFRGQAPSVLLYLFVRLLATIPCALPPRGRHRWYQDKSSRPGLAKDCTPAVFS